jgi:hypothetical protein
MGLVVTITDALQSVSSSAELKFLAPLLVCCSTVFGRGGLPFGLSFSLEEAPFLMSMERLQTEDQMSICASAMATTEKIHG